MSKNRRKRYMVTAENSEAFACSLVTSPAVEELFVAFSDEKPLIEKFADEKKHMITGVVAIPNKPIYRRDPDGEEYDLVFSADAIESMAKKFMKDFRQHNVTLQHQEDADGVYLVEQWIKTDMTYDKSISIGLSKELPVGSWIQTYYVDSNDVWQRIESGELLGFSLECALGVEEFEKEIMKNKEDNMIDVIEHENFWTKLKNVLSEAFKAASMSEREELADEKENNEIVDEVLEEETPNEPITEPSEPLSDVEPTVEPQEVVEEPTEPQNDSQEVVEEQVVEEAKPNPLEEVIKNLQEEIKALKESNTSLTEKIKDLGKKPSANPINTNAKPNTSDTYSAWREQMRNMIG